MKKLTILIFSILASFNSYGKWQIVSEADDGYAFFIDEDTISKKNGFVFFWRLTNLPTPDKDGDMSIKTYQQTECNFMRNKELSVYAYSQHMGEGSVKEYGAKDGWTYSPPGSVATDVMGYACNWVKLGLHKK